VNNWSTGHSAFAFGLLFVLLYTLLSRSDSNVTICISRVPERDLATVPLEHFGPVGEISYDSITEIDRDEEEIIEKVDGNSVLPNAHSSVLGPVTIVTIAHHQTKEFVLNWIKSLHRCNLTKFVVLSHDLQLVEFLKETNYGSQVALVPRKWYTNPHNIRIRPNSTLWLEGDEFNLIDAFKFHIVKQLISRDRSIVFSEPDAVWMSEHALEHLQLKMAHSLASVAFAQLAQRERRVGLSAGFFYAYARSNATRRLVGMLVNECDRSPSLSTANSVDLRRVLDSRVEPAFNWTEIVALDPLIYASQRVFSELRLNSRMSVRPFVVHAEYSKFAHKKIALMKENALWLL
jgi:hypothetical protein